MGNNPIDANGGGLRAQNKNVVFAEQGSSPLLIVNLSGTLNLLCAS